MTPTTPGRYRYSDPIGDTLVVNVVEDAGELVVRWVDPDTDRVELTSVKDMAGDFEGPLS